MRKSWIACLSCTLLVLGTGDSLRALNVPTHRLIARAAVGFDATDSYFSTFDMYLREALGLDEGRDTVVRSPRLTVIDLLAEGSEREDDGSRFSARGRFYRHFHNPLQGWELAGLLARYPFHLVPHQYTSSVRWMQSASQPGDDGGADGGQWTWQAARDAYYRALTAETRAERDAAAANLFRALGQVMHLVVDASVPEHVRNDPHPFGAVSRELLRSRRATNYEYWLSDEQERLGDDAFASRYFSLPAGFDQTILHIPPPSGETAAMVPIARLIDADTYVLNAPDPNATLSGAVGIAEFANANFFSEDTLFGRDPQHGRLPYPRRLDLIRRSDVAPRGSHTRAYFRKPTGQGLATNTALAECRFDSVIALPLLAPFPCVDEAVWNETATHMLPRAVRYSRGVLDYFFRGDIRVRQVLSQPNGMFIDIENNSDEAIEGVFEVYARYGKGTTAERRERVSRINEGAPVVLEPGEWDRLSLPLVADEATAYHVLVFRGRLGLEEEAVAGRVFAVPYVQVVPQSYDSDVTKTCVLDVARPTSSFPLREFLTCRWQPINHRVVGRVLTNFKDADPTDTSEPALERIEAFWQGSVPGPAPLRVNGMEHPSGIWQRSGGEPDPETFQISDPAMRRDSQLTLKVTIRGGASVIAQVPTFSTLTQEPWKQVQKITEGWRIAAGQLTVVSPNSFSLGAYTADVIGGYAYPTSISRAGESIVVTHGVLSNRFATHRITDSVETITSGSFVGVEAKYRAIVLEPPPFPEAPAVDFSTVVTAKPFDVSATRFWKAFVALSDPEPHQILLKAREPGTD